MKLKEKLSSLVIIVVLALAFCAPVITNPSEVNSASTLTFTDYPWPADDYDVLMCVRQLPNFYKGFSSTASWIHVREAGEHCWNKVRIRVDGYAGNKRIGYLTVKYIGGSVKYKVVEYGMSHK